MKTQHTSGPWKHAKRGDYDTHGIGILANNEAGLPYYVATAGFMGTADHRYAEANARLIAAAPQMLAALRAALEAMGDSYDARDAAGPEGEQLRDQIAEAIASATGETADY